jgi:hypothetical protein
MTANLSSLCAALCSNWEIRKRLTDYSELTFFTSNLLKNKINFVSLFQITLIEDFWWPVSRGGLAPQILVGFIFKGPPKKKLLPKQKC